MHVQLTAPSTTSYALSTSILYSCVQFSRYLVCSSSLFHVTLIPRFSLEGGQQEELQIVQMLSTIISHFGNTILSRQQLFSSTGVLLKLPFFVKIMARHCPITQVASDSQNKKTEKKKITEKWKWHTQRMARMHSTGFSCHRGLYKLKILISS